MKKILVLVAIVAIGGVAAYVVLGSSADADTSTPTTTIAAEGPVVEADEMVVTLADEGTARYARIRLGVVLPEGGDVAAVNGRLPLLKGGVLEVLSAYTAADLQGPDGLARLRSQFMDQSSAVWHDGEVLRVVITELLVQ